MAIQNEKNRIYAALTGDLVKSSKLTPEELIAAKNCLADAVGRLDELVGEKNGPVAVGGIDFYRGDGWQLLLARPQYALRVSLFLRGCLRANDMPDTRICTGFATVSHIEPDQISQSIGKAFELSGTALDKLKGRRRMTCSLPYYMDREQALMASIFELSDAIVQKWTVSQAQKVIWALRGLTLEEISKKLETPIKPQSVSEQLNTADWSVLEETINNQEMWTIKHLNTPNINP